MQNSHPVIERMASVRLLAACLVLFCCGCSRQSSLPPQAVAPKIVAPKTQLEGKSGDTSETAGNIAPVSQALPKSTNKVEFRNREVFMRQDLDGQWKPVLSEK
jgi:hypothetical protein